MKLSGTDTLQAGWLASTGAVTTEASVQSWQEAAACYYGPSPGGCRAEIGFHFSQFCELYKVKVVRARDKTLPFVLFHSNTFE